MVNRATWPQILTYSFAMKLSDVEGNFEKGKPVARRGRKTFGSAFLAGWIARLPKGTNHA
jgi:hypothetical protein